MLCTGGVFGFRRVNLPIINLMSSQTEPDRHEGDASSCSCGLHGYFASCVVWMDSFSSESLLWKTLVGVSKLMLR